MQIRPPTTRGAIWSVALLVACTLCQAANSSTNSASSLASTNSWNVRDLGAKGDGHTKDTAALQKALDACVSAGGGTVVMPAGNYLIGSIVLGSNTTLKLEARANLTGSPDIDDYPLARVRWEGEFAQGHRALISSEKADHVTITGPGSIFGPPISVSSLRRPRGPVLIELANGTNVVLEGFTTQIPTALVDSPVVLPESPHTQSHHSLRQFQRRWHRRGFLPGRADRALQHRHRR